jgi:hypothetical protein
MGSILHTLPAALAAYSGPLIALAVALAGAGLCRGKGARAYLPAVGALACVAGWAVVTRSAWPARSGPGLVLVPGAAACVLALLASWTGARRQRWAAVLSVVIAGWWLAEATAGRVEFWRVWFAACALGWVLSRGMAEEPGRGLASALALWGGLAVTGLSPGWAAVALVAAAAWAGLAAAGRGAFVPTGAMTGLVVATDLALGRLPRGGLNAADFACIAAVGAPFLSGALLPRAKRFGAAGPVASGLIAAGVCVGAAWVAWRAIRA